MPVTSPGTSPTERIQHNNCLIYDIWQIYAIWHVSPPVATGHMKGYVCELGQAKLGKGIVWTLEVCGEVGVFVHRQHTRTGHSKGELLTGLRMRRGTRGEDRGEPNESAVLTGLVLVLSLYHHPTPQVLHVRLSSGRSYV